MCTNVPTMYIFDTSCHSPVARFKGFNQLMTLVCYMYAHCAISLSSPMPICGGAALVLQDIFHMHGFVQHHETKEIFYFFKNRFHHQNREKAFDKLCSAFYFFLSVEGCCLLGRMSWSPDFEI